MAELTPVPFASLLRRMLREHEREDKVFDLPARRFWHGSADLDTSVRYHGNQAANPLGPAAGPHVQMAHNIVVCWLAGARIIELKTVQIQDQLKIPRPCIDAANLCFNIEWSQELSLEQSRQQYVAASMLIDILKELNLLGLASDVAKQPTLLDLSLGYDLAGIASPRLRSWVSSMKDATEVVESLRRQIPEDLRRLRDLDFSTSISRQVTLSTFHGCPASEIEDMASLLLTELGLDVTLKLNPTLLGKRRVDALLHEALGYHEIETRAEDFDTDLHWEQALEMVDRLSERAASLGRGFGVKLTNTLVVKNHRRIFPPSQSVHYLSGQPLHVISMNLVERFRQARPELAISFSAGVDNRNFADCVSLGLTPVTTCTDLLRPGGYGRLQPYLGRLEERMRALGVRNIGDFIIKSQGKGGEAVEAVVDDEPLRSRLLACLASESVELRAVLAAAGRDELYEKLVLTASANNAPVVLTKVMSDPRYRAEANRSSPRKVGSKLWLFDCLSCDKCLPVCPNDANFVYEIDAVDVEYSNYQVRAGAVTEVPGGQFQVRKTHQIANFQDLCNDCGNCDTFCPEDGGPFIEKPRLFGSLDAWKAQAPRAGLFVIRLDDIDAAWGRLGGREYHLEVDRARDRGLFTDGRLTVETRHSLRLPVQVTVKADAEDGHELDFVAYLSMALIIDGVYETRRTNPVNASVP